MVASFDVANIPVSGNKFPDETMHSGRFKRGVNSIVKDHTVGEQGGFLVRQVPLGIRIRFACHEAYALKAARTVPILALFAFGTLWVWSLPIVLVCILYMFFMNAGVWGAIVNMALGIGGLVFLVRIFPWFFRWYFMCLGLMFGRTRMACSKEDEVLDRLRRLKRAKATKHSI